LAIGPAATSVSGSHPATDADLLDVAAKGRDRKAFQEIVSRHYAGVYRVVWRLTGGQAQAEDITQETFLRLWSNPAQIRDAGALRGWLVRVASNLVMDGFRAGSTRDLDSIPETADQRPDAEMESMRNWASRRIDRAVAGLPERQRLALTLVHFEQMSNGAAAAAMDVSVDALESLLARARRALKEELKTDRESLLQAMDLEGHAP
jgi:RNA polymerase sigma-70 factor (ECF subfamily)